ncbi:negative transcriptional regulator [Novosphingobium nitrogenifigens DSM 19370]|uniref:Negative transcriptional regulator n=1 Tax=Novosphingobium nitrogenifigens DSM 19370 TaxID=983920 RepID=F1ZBM2_9SPHN|nr:FMN-binding negative transcriptional regulator [Novosphingobium nitrogenifigens]EGD57893.1 negative transcriptional regulator [Novosphingobium nitrogenifigens DSM 19370]
MHPNPAFRLDDRDLCVEVIEEVGFGMVFATTPDGPRVAHTPLLHRDGRIAFHLARGNALTRHLETTGALVVVNGPDGYVSPRWYADPAQVPTWNYVAIECEGSVRRLDRAGLVELLAGLSSRHEARLDGAPWTLDKVPETTLSRLLDAIVGFELDVTAWRPTFKLSQNKPADERARVTMGLETTGAGGIAALMRALVP